MAAPEDLRVMDLKLKATNDECLVYGQWNRMAAVHALAKLSYQSDVPKDDGDWWRYAAPSATTSSQAPRCNLPVAVARLSANIPAGGAYNNDRIIPEEGFVIKEKLAIWSKKQMMFAKASENNFKHLDVAAPMNAYPVGNYVNYVPIPVVDTDKFKDEFVAHHVGLNPGLQKNTFR